VLPSQALRSASEPDRLLSVIAVPNTPARRVVVEVVGEVDTFTAPLLHLCLQSQAAQSRVRELVVDMGGVTFLSAAGISVLVQAHRRCRMRGGRLVLRGSRRAVLRCMKLTGLTDIVTLRPAAFPGSRSGRVDRTGDRGRTWTRRGQVHRTLRTCR
jgi:anti-sigma B factor antagonist